MDVSFHPAIASGTPEGSSDVPDDRQLPELFAREIDAPARHSEPYRI
jgi:hypothetical protein